MKRMLRKGGCIKAPPAWEAQLRGWSCLHTSAPVQCLNVLAGKHGVMTAIQHRNIPTGMGAEPFNLRALRIASAHPPATLGTQGAPDLPVDGLPPPPAAASAAPATALIVWNLVLDWEEENQKKGTCMTHLEAEPIRRCGMAFELASVGERLAEKWAARILTPFEPQ